MQKRYKQHLEGKGAKYTRSFKPVKIGQSWCVFIDRSIAQKVEAYIKSLSRKEKEGLIERPELLVNLFGNEIVSVCTINQEMLD